MIFIGTAGYSYRDWIGPYYPPGTASDKMLELYAAEFFLWRLTPLTTVCLTGK